MARRILIFSITMGAEYLSYVKFIASEAPTFFGYILSVLANMSWLQEESIPLWRHIYLSVTFLTLSSWIGHAEVIFTEKVGVFARKIEAKDRETFAL